MFVPSSPLLTDSLATVAAPQATYTYAAPGITAPIAMPFYGSDGSWQGTAVSANPGTPTDADNTWSGFGVPVFGCVDASEFAGVRFNLQGDLGSCQLTFGVISRDNNSVLYGGGCTAEACYGPRSAPLAPGANTLLFSELTGGNPNPSVDASQINDIEWQLTAPVGGPPCSANFTITEVAFVSSPASSPELCEEFCALSVAPSQACYIQATVADCLPRCALVADLAPQCEPKMVPMLECMIAANVWTCQDTPSSIFPDPDICVPEVVALQECLVAP